VNAPSLIAPADFEAEVERRVAARLRVERRAYNKNVVVFLMLCGWIFAGWVIRELLAN
jgi:hypothetical protein